MSFFRKKPVMILGCGPAGLFAAQAALDCGYPFVIFSRKRPSQMFGAQYLHGEVRNLPAKQFTIEYVLQGSAYDYAAKVYGPESASDLADKVSPARLLGRHKAWDIREAYSRAWDRFEPYIVDTTVNADWLAAADVHTGDYCLVVNSIPAHFLCRVESGSGGGHAFAVAEVHAIGDAPEKGVECPVKVPLNTVVCNGEPSPSWYRASNVNGFHSAEWPLRIRPPVGSIARISKPLSTNCDCWMRRRDLPMGPMLRVGRYGTWTKGVLSHDAYSATRDKLS